MVKESAAAALLLSLPLWISQSEANDRISSKPGDSEACKNRSGGFLSEPRIEIYSVKESPNRNRTGKKVSGTIEGVCITEAGIYDRGKLIQEIPVVTSPLFKRFDFTIASTSNSQPEIRAYNIDGSSKKISMNSPSRVCVGKCVN